MNNTHERCVDTRKLARRIYNEIRREDSYTHPSFAAEKALEEAAAQTGLEHHGVEGFTIFGSMHDGLSYLNMGDAYDETVYAVTSENDASFHTGSWGDWVEANPGATGDEDEEDGFCNHCGERVENCWCVDHEDEEDDED